MAAIWLAAAAGHRDAGEALAGSASGGPLHEIPPGAGQSEHAFGPDAFSRPLPGMTREQAAQFARGEALFKLVWLAAPAENRATDGLGPLYNARSCQRCHLNNGRGRPPEGAAAGDSSTVLKLSIPAGSRPLQAAIADWIATAPDPVYGMQLQDAAAPGLAAEHRLAVTWEEVEIALSEGETASLRRPTWRAEALGYGPLHPEAMLSPRTAAPMIGLGLLEAIAEEDILAGADPGGDAVGGRPAVVWSAEFGRPMLGRFGWKAAAPTLREQTAGALWGDMGLSNPLHPEPWGDCTPAQTACRGAPHGVHDDLGPYEVDAAALDDLAFYSAHLAPPPRREADHPEVIRGEAVFHAAGCAACHRPAFTTRRIDGAPALSERTIRPYTDLLLHDMGEGLADGRPEGVATGREWRTAPLWGVGLTAVVNGHMQLLHDGRARGILEAILWHGGAAQAARDAVVAMPKADRDALIRFVGSL